MKEIACFIRKTLCIVKGSVRVQAAAAYRNSEASKKKKAAADRSWLQVAAVPASRTGPKYIRHYKVYMLKNKVREPYCGNYGYHIYTQTTYLTGDR